MTAQVNWAKLLPGVGTFSSPCVTDPNHDGVVGIVVGVGRRVQVRPATKKLRSMNASVA
ncbi:hypothetical protein [Spirosoma pulveris]